jgi:nitrate/nitrite-specific signal transduction histidine kinase
MPDSAEEKDNLLQKGKQILHILEESKEFTRSLLTMNEKLRYQNTSLKREIEELKKELKTSQSTAQRKEIELLKNELEELKKRYLEVEEENKDFATQYIQVEEQNNNLANLYIASYQLHSTLDFSEVIQIITEIIINLIGAEKFSIFLLDEKKQELGGVATEGIDLDIGRNIALGEGIVGTVAEKGEIYLVEADKIEESYDLNRPIACVPLMIKKHLIGIIVVYKLLEQKKEGFSSIDYELFSLLAGHAATAIYSAKLYSHVERKLNTIESFMELLTGRKKGKGKKEF